VEAGMLVLECLLVGVILGAGVEVSVIGMPGAIHGAEVFMILGSVAAGDTVEV